jgi:hypothetical protein
MTMCSELCTAFLSWPTMTSAQTITKPTSPTYLMPDGLSGIGKIIQGIGAAHGIGGLLVPDELATVYGLEEVSRHEGVYVRVRKPANSRHTDVRLGCIVGLPRDFCCFETGVDVLRVQKTKSTEIHSLRHLGFASTAPSTAYTTRCERIDAIVHHTAEKCLV